MSVFKNIIQVGQRVYCSLPYCGHGTVVKIVGEQSPDSCQTVARSVCVAGGRARFDIVWDHGSRSAQTPEALLRASVQWRVSPEVVDAAAVAEAEALAERTARDKQAAQDEADREHGRRMTQLANDPELADLTRIENGVDASKIAAANIRKLLKKQFKGVKFSVRKDGYSAINVSWTDGPTVAQVKEVTQRFERGSFNGMTDSYDYKRSPWCQVFGGVDYVFESRELSDEHKARAIDALWKRYPANLAGIDKPTPEALRAGECNWINVPGFNDPLPTLIRLEALELAG